MIYVPVAIFWIFALWAFASRGPALLYLFFGSMAFGSFAVIPTVLTAGLTFTAVPIIMLLLIARALLAPGGMGFFLTSALRFDRLALLFLFWIVAIITTLLMPRIFAGEVLVVGVRDVRSGASLLAPTAQNFSQLVYISISIFAVFALSKMLRSREDRQHALKAAVFGAGVLAVTGALDYIGNAFAPVEVVLSLFRTASYAFAIDVEVLGGQRVVGLMPEASTFGGMCLGFLSILIFFRRVIEDPQVRKFWAPVLIGLLAIMIYLSTSSGALLGLGVLAMVLAADAMFRAFTRGQRGQMQRGDLLGEAGIVVGLLTLAGLIVVFVPQVFDPVVALLDRMVFSKSSSGSFEERGMWRQISFEALLATNGLGVGLGSTRTSSHFVSILASTGFLGGLLYFGFVVNMMLRPSRRMDWEGQLVLTAFRFSYVPTFVLGLLVGGPDFGGLTAFAFGIAVAVSTVHREQERRYRPRAAMPPGMASGHAQARLPLPR